jgi:hypothetical protein
MCCAQLSVALHVTKRSDRTCALPRSSLENKGNFNACFQLDLRDRLIGRRSGIPDVDGLVGFNFFEKHRVCFDYQRRTVSVR